MFAPDNTTNDSESDNESESSLIGVDASGDGMGDLALGPEILSEDTAAEDHESAVAAEPARPVRVAGRRAIPVEDVDALWVFAELDLNARVLVFLAQHKVPVHFFNYYGFYAGSFYPREYLQAGYLLVKQVQHYTNRRLRVAIAQEFVRAGLHNIMRNLRYYANRGTDLQTETESLQAEILQLDGVSAIDELMGSNGDGVSGNPTRLNRTRVELKRAKARFNSTVDKGPLSWLTPHPPKPVARLGPHS